MEFSRNFVCEDHAYSTYENHVPAPLFRKSFILSQQPQEAQITICGLGFYRIWVNGAEITKGWLAPYISNPDHYTYYDSYDLTGLLNCGENVIGVMLGSGMQNPMSYVWDFYKAVFSDAPKLACSFTAQAGQQQLSFDAADMRCSKSEILFDNMRSGVFCDARLAQPGWNDRGFDENGWHTPLKAQMPRGRAKLCTAEPICTLREIAPVNVRPAQLAPDRIRGDVAELCEGKTFPENAVPSQGGYLYDFGVNTAGVFRLKIHGAPGQKISFQCAEMLDGQGRVDYSNISGFYPHGYAQRDIYICRGDKEEEFTPPFTYHGCRYIYVHGITPVQAVPELLTFLELSSKLAPRGDFSCSDETVNTLWQMTLRSDRSNFFYFPNDCPHREKNGWTGDAQLSCEHMTLEMATENSYREWLCNIRAAQKETGALPGIVPTDSWGYDWGNGPAWDSVLFNLPYVLYRYRGDTQVIKENAHAMLSYLEYAASLRQKDGTMAFGLGDWLPVGRGAAEYQAPLGLTCTVLVYDMCRKAQKMFAAIGQSASAAYAENLGGQLLQTVRREYIDFSTMTALGRCQTSQAVCLAYGIFTPAESVSAYAVLRRLVAEKADNFDCGIIGMRVLLHVLADFGDAELAYHLITKKEFPSYACWIDRGETTLLESFMPTNSCGSHNHHMFGDINHWFLRHIAGICINPNGDDPLCAQIRPCFIAGLTHAQGCYDTVAGKLSVHWHKEDAKAWITVTAPEQVACRTVLPQGWYTKKGDLSCFEGSSENLEVYCIHG